MSYKSLSIRQAEARAARARAERLIRRADAMIAEHHAEQESRSTYGQYQAEMRKAQREFAPLARKWSNELEVIKRRFDSGESAYSPADYVQDQMLEDSIHTIPKIHQGWR